MKKISPILFTVLVLACCIFAACEKDDSNPPPSGNNNNNNTIDTIPPVITIIGANPVTVTLNSSYVDAGATATDNVDGTVIVISDASSTNPDVNLAGTYTLTYSAIDSAGNQATAIRTVIVGNDMIPPVITIIGANPVTVTLNSSYVEAGATATDNVNGSVTVTSNVSSTNPDVNLAGTYTITYSATDSVGNQTTATRTVIVRNDAYYLEGTYITTEGSSNWMQTITASVTVNSRIHFSKFANYTTNNSIYALVIGNQVDLISAQNGVNIGAAGCDHVFAPNGTGTPISASMPITFSIKFTDQQLAGGSGCPAIGALPYEDIFVKL